MLYPLSSCKSKSSIILKKVLLPPRLLIVSWILHANPLPQKALCFLNYRPCINWQIGPVMTDLCIWIQISPLKKKKKTIMTIPKTGFCFLKYCKTTVYYVWHLCILKHHKNTIFWIEELIVVSVMFQNKILWYLTYICHYFICIYFPSLLSLRNFLGTVEHNVQCTFPIAFTWLLLYTITLNPNPKIWS